MSSRSQLKLSEKLTKRLLNVREAAFYLGLAPDTVYTKSRLGEIPSVKVGRALRFDVKALDIFVEEQKRQAEKRIARLRV